MFCLFLLQFHYETDYFITDVFSKDQFQLDVKCIVGFIPIVGPSEAVVKSGVGSS